MYGSKKSMTKKQGSPIKKTSMKVVVVKKK
jgi:hypothetical protein